MPWLLLDLALVLGALILLGLLSLRLWRQVKDLTAAVRRASQTLAPATQAMAQSQAQAQAARVQPGDTSRSAPDA